MCFFFIFYQEIMTLRSLYLWDHVLEGFHDLGALSFLEIGEAACDDDDRRQHDAQIQLQNRQRGDN